MLTEETLKAWLVDIGDQVRYEGEWVEVVGYSKAGGDMIELELANEQSSIHPRTAQLRVLHEPSTKNRTMNLKGLFGL